MERYLANRFLSGEVIEDWSATILESLSVATSQSWTRSFAPMTSEVT